MRIFEIQTFFKTKFTILRSDVKFVIAKSRFNFSQIFRVWKTITKLLTRADYDLLHRTTDKAWSTAVERDHLRKPLGCIATPNNQQLLSMELLNRRRCWLVLA